VGRWGGGVVGRWGGVSGGTLYILNFYNLVLIYKEEIINIILVV
jgi:hypothetical protein